VSRRQIYETSEIDEAPEIQKILGYTNVRVIVEKIYIFNASVWCILKFFEFQVFHQFQVFHKFQEFHMVQTVLFIHASPFLM